MENTAYAELVKRTQQLILIDGEDPIRQKLNLSQSSADKEV